MPMDLSVHDNILKGLQQQDVDSKTQDMFREAIGSKDLNTAFHIFAKAFEGAAGRSAQLLGQGPLKPKYQGRAKGHLVKARESFLQLSSDGTVLSDRMAFRKRQKAFRLIRELARS